MLHDLTIRGMWEGIHANGANATIDGLTFDANCDDGFTGEALAFGTVVRNSMFLCATDKCSQEDGQLTENLADRNSDASLRGYYNTTYENVTWTACQKPIRVSSGLANGRYRILNSTMTGSESGQNSTCDAVALSGSGYTLVDGIDMMKCTQGFILGGSMEANIRNSTFVENGDRGLAVQRDAKAIVNHSLFQGNGTEPLSTSGNAGVSRRDLEVCSGDPPDPKKCTPSDHAEVDLGGGDIDFLDGPSDSSGGLNNFKQNKRGTSIIAVDNNTGVAEGVTIQARFNCWNDTDPSDEVAGPVVTTSARSPGDTTCLQP